MKFLKSFLLAFIALTATANLAFSQATITAQISAENTKTITVKVKGVNCAMDLKSIATNVENLEGVSSCKTVKQGATTIFDVAYNPVLVEQKDIHAAIEGTAGCENPNDRPYKVKLKL